MICVSLFKPRLSHFGVSTHYFIFDADVISQAKAENSTRAVQAIRKAQCLGLLENSIVAVVNAPTALLEVIRMIKEENLRPVLIVEMPVGFVSAAESKDGSALLNDISWMNTQGRIGGSILVVAAIYALLALAEQSRAVKRPEPTSLNVLSVF